MALKILHIASRDYGGAGIAAMRLHKGLLREGADSTMLVLQKQTSEPSVVQYQERRESLVYRFFRMMCEKRHGEEFKRAVAARKEGMDTFSGWWTPYRVEEHSLVLNADIIHLHWITRFVNPKLFFNKTRRKKIIWTLHDRNPVTGGCHVFGGCTKYQSICKACPQLFSDKPHDYARKSYLIKKKAYELNDIRVVSPSLEYSEYIQNSSLLGNKKVSVIPNSVDAQIFSKGDKEAARQLLNLPSDKTIMLFSAQYASKVKGARYLIKALENLQSQVSKDGLLLLTLGNVGIEPGVICGVEVRNMGYVDCEQTIARIYNAADLTIVTSTEESFGQVCLESMSCGVPVIAFPVGGMRDMIDPQVNGMIAEYKNAEDLAAKILYLVNYPDQRKKMGLKAEEKSVNYRVEKQVKEYMNLYKRIQHES